MVVTMGGIGLMFGTPSAAAQTSVHQKTPAVAAEARPMTIAELEAAWPSLTPKQQFIAIEQLLKGAQFDAASRLLARSSYQVRGDIVVKRFYEGMIARGQGRNPEAVAIFREVLAQNPEFTRVRLELAHTLFAINEDDSARHNFELVLGSTSATPGLENAVRSYINAIDGRRRWDFTAFMTIAPSTNVNQGASSQTVDLNGLPFQLDQKNVKKSGVGVYAGFQAGYRHPLTDTLDLVVSGGAQAKRYKDDEFNEALVNLTVGPKMRFDRGFLGLYGIVDHRWLSDRDYSTSFGGILSGGFSFTAADLVFADTGCSQKKFNDDWLATDLTYQNGYLCFFSARYDHYFDSRTYARVLGNLTYEQADRDHLDSAGKGIGLGLYREIPWGISVYLQGLYTQTDFDGDYPGFGKARRDDRFDVSVNLTKRDLVFFGFAPQIQYTYTHNESNIPFHVYNGHSGALTLTKRF